ncbi:MAG: hypothetical protein A2Y33_04010 [Spirochaetes bacterium GWF1_51_8]|nr:MAG: hypothetical protein A2Y33_04010 [Spirochaetes bacterium GWF1_51_8]
MISSLLTKLKNFITHNWLQKSISVVVAVGIWYYVNSLEITEQTLNLPIAFINVPQDYMIVSSSESITELSLNARKNILKNNSILVEIKPFVDLTDARIGEYEYKISLNITNPDLKNQVNLTKQYVTIKIDRIENKTLPIKPKIIGQVSEGYVMESIVLNTNNAALTGAAESLKDIVYIETGPIDITGVTNDIESVVKLSTPQNIASILPSEVLVQIQIQEKRVTREEVFPVKLINLPPGYYSSQPLQVFLILNIPGSLLPTYKEKIVVTADCSGVSAEGSYNLPIVIDAPKAIQIVNKVKYLSIPLQFTHTNQ